MTAPRDQRDPLISGPPKFRWPWDQAKDVDIGDRVRAPSDSIDRPAAFRMPEFKAPSGVGFRRLPGENAPSPLWRTLPVRIVLFLALIYHLAPQISRVVGEKGAGVVLTLIGEQTPHILGVDVGRWFAQGASAWVWQPLMPALGAGILRLVALNTIRRDPIGAIWIGAVALTIDAASWLFIGLKLSGVGYSPAEGAALVTLLKVEAATLFGLFCFLAPTGKRKLGETDAHFNRG